MPIEFTCPHCQSVLRVEDANAGKRARCPHCNVINRIPGERIDEPAAPPVSQQFFIESVSGRTYGPVTSTELDQWVAEGRVSGDCLVRATGEREGRPAAVLYPDLAKTKADGDSDVDSAPNSDFKTATSSGSFRSDFSRSGSEAPSSDYSQKPFDANPYASPTSTKDPFQHYPPINIAGLHPVKADLGEIFSRSWDVFTQNVGLLLGVGVVCGLMQLLINFVDVMTDNMHGAGAVLAALTLLVLNLVQIYLAIGQTRISLKLIRGEQAEFAELFNGGDKFFSVIGFFLLIFIPVMVALLMLIVPGIFLLLYIWPCYMLIIDYKTNVFESFDPAMKMAGANLLNSFVLGLSTFGIVLLGMALCFVGFFFANAYVSVLWAMAYLLMSGQIASQKH